MQAEDSFVTDKKQTKNDDYVLYCAMLLQQQLQSRSGVACTVAVLTGDRPLTAPMDHEHSRLSDGIAVTMSDTEPRL